MSFRSGFISIVGSPNGGKQPPLNSMRGEKISIVSPKPQTTRNVVRGVKNLAGCQMIFIDTPGIHKAKGLLNEFMVKQAVSSLQDVDAVVLLVEADRPVSEDDRFIIQGFKGLRCPVILGVNKIDKVDKRLLLPLIDEYTKMYEFKEVIPLSALKGEGVELLVTTLSDLLPEGPMYFPEDVLTDVPERFIVAEIVREKVFIFTKEEIPHSR